MTMRVGVCGIACEKCPKMQKSTCPNGTAVVLQGKTSFAKYAIVHTLKVSSSVLSAASFPVKQPSKAQSAMATVNTFQASNSYISIFDTGLILSLGVALKYFGVGRVFQTSAYTSKQANKKI